ncbi:hypothetical protein EII25_02210 [Erysipelotrichaceae bacterium OH741_COT-311]|nr:hypothetical protein EII25_02210 [Erysipelotrichaceae bacterium OH741_COT-311]
MQKKWNMNTPWVLLLLTLIIILFFVAYIVKIHKQSNATIHHLHGTFITEENQSPSAQYLVFDQSQHMIYYYDQLTFALQGSYSTTDDTHVYLSTINSNPYTIFVKDNDHIIFMKDNVPHKYVRLSNYLEFIGEKAQSYSN